MSERKTIRDVDDVKENTLTALNSILPQKFQHCCQQWQKRWDKCINAHGQHFEVLMHHFAEITEYSIIQKEAAKSYRTMRGRGGTDYPQSIARLTVGRTAIQFSLFQNYEMPEFTNRDYLDMIQAAEEIRNSKELLARILHNWTRRCESWTHADGSSNRTKVWQWVPPFPLISNIYMEYFEELALSTASHKPILWLRYVDDTFIIWPHSPQLFDGFLIHLNSLRPSIQFTMELEKDNCLPFLDVLVTRDQDKLATTVYRKSTHTGRYLHFQSNHPTHVKRGIISTLLNRANYICNKESDLQNEVQSLTNTFVTNGYPQEFIKKAISHNQENKSDPPAP
ncbi:hypothetical protein ANN_13130 [Periplaneta americana]|uniref:Helix-turn-helix domain-containing protein n=1 Tax=Periplaneta americana TaxID=6978 RepID=A0ABQ8TKN8_PERAM|nr:hypothetical protein ANN_13130 [Periplaneta americana]